MKISFISFIFLILVNLFFIACDGGITLSHKSKHTISSEYLLKIDGDENLAEGVKKFLKREQMLSSRHREQLNTRGISSQANNAYLPENHPKFPLPYYLIPKEDINALFTNSLDPKIADQLSIKISGKKHFKLFIHPKLEESYDFLRLTYNYIGPDQTEFFASPTSSYKNLVVWNKNNNQRQPFIVKIVLDKTTIGRIDKFSHLNEIERSIANQKSLDTIDKKTFEQINLFAFRCIAGLTIQKYYHGVLKKIEGQLVYEIPDVIFNEKNKWPLQSINTETNNNINNPTMPTMMNIIKRNGISSYDFFKIYMINMYLKLVEETSFKKGINFKINTQNISFETSDHIKPIIKWVIYDIGEILPDIISMEKHSGPITAYMADASAEKYKLREGLSSFISNYIFYKYQVFNVILEDFAKNDPKLSNIDIQNLQTMLDEKYKTLINAYLHLDLQAAPTTNNYKKIEELVFAQAKLEDNIAKKKIANSETVQFFITNKKNKQEWVQLSTDSKKDDYYLTDHGLYRVTNNKVIGFSLFNPDELENYNTNHKMLSSLISSNKQISGKEIYFQMAAFLLKKITR